MRHGHQRHQDGASLERQNAELKSALQGPEPLFEGHLAHAERVQSATGEAWRYVARKKRTYNYTCSYHPKMTSKWIVQ